MTEQDKIHEELRQYKLFKIQRINTRIQEFTEVKKDLKTMRRNEFLHYFLFCINAFLQMFLVYNIVRSVLETDFFWMNEWVILTNALLCIAIAGYLTYLFFHHNKKLYRFIEFSDNALQQFSTEKQNLHAVYENYVETYMQEVKHKTGT